MDTEKCEKSMDKYNHGEVAALLEGIVAEVESVMDTEKCEQSRDKLKNKHGEVAALLEGIVTQTAYIVDAEDSNKCNGNLSIQAGEDMGVTLDVSKKEKTMNVTKKADEVLDANDDITLNKNGIDFEKNGQAQLHHVANENEIELIELSDDEEYSSSPPVEPIVNPSQMQFQFSASNIELTVPNEAAQNSADEKNQGGRKRSVIESIFLPYYEENNAGVHNFNSDTTENLAVNDENETWRKNCNNGIQRQCAGMNSGYVQFLSYKNSKTAASGKAKVDEKQSSKQKKNKQALTRHSLMKNLKDEIEQKKQASFDRHRKIEEADEEIYNGKDKQISDSEDGEIYEGEADDEDDFDRDGFCPEEKLFPDSSNFSNSQSHAFHQRAVPSSSYVQPVIIQGSQPFLSQDIQMICSGQFSHDENQLSAWSPKSQRKIETDEEDDDVVIIDEKMGQSFKDNSALKRKLEGFSPSTKNKKFKEDNLSSCSSPPYEETFPSYSPETREDCSSPFCPTPTNQSSDGEDIIPGAKKCKVLNYSSEEDDEGNEFVIDDKGENISRQVAMISPCKFISANMDNANSSYQKKSEFFENCLDSNDVDVSKSLNIADDKGKNIIPKSIESPDYSISAKAKEKSLNIMELSLQVNDHDTALQKPKKMYLNSNEFLEMEAELDSNEEASSDESESEIPDEQKDDLFDDVPVNEENPQELAIIHHKYLCEDDAQVVKQLQEQYLPGGELHEEGKGRQKKFLWNNNDSSAAPNETLMSDSDQEEVAETSISQEKAIWRQKATVVHGSDEESDDINTNKKSARNLPVNIVGKVNTSQVIDKSYFKASPSSTAMKVRRSGSLIGVNVSNKLSLKTSDTEQRKTVLFKAMQDAHQQDGI